MISKAIGWGLIAVGLVCVIFAYGGVTNLTQGSDLASHAASWIELVISLFAGVVGLVLLGIGAIAIKRG